MKEKTKNENRNASQKSSLRWLLLLLSVLLLPMLFCIQSSAADLRSENLTLCEARSAELETQLASFKKIDTSEGGTYAQSVVSAVNRYRKQLLDLQSHPEIAIRSLEKEIELAFLRGTVAGRLTWIYVTNAAVAVNETESRSFLASYEALMRTLDETEELTAASPTSFSRDLSVAIYSERIRSLATNGDSLRVGAILAGAIEEVRGLNSGELSGDAYRAILENARQEATLQRYRDILYGDFCSFYVTLNPSAKAESDEITSLLLHRLLANTTLSDMNNSLNLAADALLDRFGTETHKKAYIATVGEQIDREISSAKNVGRAACISALVSDFPLRYLIADAKDRVDADVSASPYAPTDDLTRIASEYTAEGGILDRCANETEIGFELWRASLRVDWWEELVAAKERIATLLAPHDIAAMQKKVETEWKAMDARICAVLRTAPDAKESCTQALSQGRNAFAAFLLDTEAERFRLDHIAMIEKAPNALTASDRNTLIFAIEDWKALSVGAKERLASETGKLRESYRAVIGLVIKETLKNDKAFELRKSNIDKLCEQIAKLSAIDLSDFMDAADGLATKAHSIQVLLDRYHDILESSDYNSYVEKYHFELRSVSEAGCLAILSLSFSGNTPNEELSALLSRSLLNLTKSHALARIDLAAEQSTRPEVTSALRIAEAQIGAATTEESVNTLADACILAVRKVILSEDAEELANVIEQKLDALSFLSEAQRKELGEQLSSKKGEILAAIPLAADLTELKLSYTTYTIECEEILARGEAISLTACKEDARDRLLALIAHAQEELTALPEPEEEIKAQFRTNLEALQTEYLASIHLAKTEAKIASLLTEVQAKANTQITDARLYKIRLHRAELLDKLETEFGIPLHYSEEHYASIRSIIEEFRGELESRDTSEEYENLLKNATEKLSLIPTLLAEAKDASTIVLQEEYNRLLQQAATYSQANLTLLQETLSQTLTSIEGITEILDYPMVYELSKEGVKALLSIPRDRLCNGPVSLNGASYPTNFDPQANGLWGVITQAGAIPSERTLSIHILQANSDDFSNRIQNAIQQKKLFRHDGETLSFSLRKQLKKANLLLALDIQTVLPTTSGRYRVEILLPSEYDTQDLLGVVWLGADGSAEYYNFEISGSVLSFETSHFSTFYLVAKSKTNLLPAILFVSFLILAELAVLVLLLYRRNRRRREATALVPENDPPALPFSAFLAPTSLLSKTVPPNGTLLLTLLTGTALLLGVAVALLVKDELAWMRSEQARKYVSKQATKKAIPRLSATRRMALPTAKASLAVIKAHGDRVPSTDSENDLGGIALADRETNPKEDEPFSDEILTDEIKWTELNLDILSRYFTEGDCVTPELLKQMGLIPENTTHLKILARGRLNVPLFISAQDFSNAALRAIKKAGGKAYRIQ